MSRIERDGRRQVTALEESRYSGPAMVALAESAAAAPYAGTALNIPVPGRCHLDLRATEAMVLSSSSCGDGEGCVSDTAPPSPLCVGGCTEALHELSNLMTAIVLNAQAMECKLPPYSHLKRPVREMSRSAQRSGQLMKQLMRRCSAGCGRTQPGCGE